MPQPETGGGGGPANGILPTKSATIPHITFLDDQCQYVDEDSAKAILAYCQALVPDNPLTLNSVHWNHGPLGSDPYPMWYLGKPGSSAMYECALIGQLMARFGWWAKWRLDQTLAYELRKVA